MKHTEVIINDNISLPYNDETESFHSEIDFYGNTTEIDFACDQEDDKSIEKMKAMLEKLLKDPGKWHAEWVVNIEDQLLPQIGTLDFMSGIKTHRFSQVYKLSNIAFVKHNENDILIEASFFETDSEDEEDPNTICISGNFDIGFRDFYVNGFHLGSIKTDIHDIKRPDHKLSTGDLAVCEFGEDTYIASVKVGDEYVDCVFALDEDNVGADKAFALFEKIYAKIDVFEQMALKYLSDHIDAEICNIRKEMEEPDLTTDEILDEMVFNIMYFTNSGRVEFGYDYYGELFDADLSVSGTYNMGFTKFSYVIDPLDE